MMGLLLHFQNILCQFGYLCLIELIFVLQNLTAILVGFYFLLKSQYFLDDIVLGCMGVCLHYNYHRLLMGKRIEADKKLFFDTLKDVRKLVAEHRGDYAKDVMGLKKHNTKVPFTHLQGRRNKMHERHQKEKERAREEAIQYDSSMKLLNSSVMEIKKEKDTFERNKYKFQNVSSGKLGREKDGFLHISKQDLARINGKEEGDRRQRQNGKPQAKGGKKRFISKNKKFKNKRK